MLVVVIRVMLPFEFLNCFDDVLFIFCSDVWDDFGDHVLLHKRDERFVQRL